MLQEDNTGAEYLAKYLNQAFSRPIHLLTDLGGFVSHFIGDAVCFIFPEPLPKDFLIKAERISLELFQSPPFHSPWGDFPITIRQMVAIGEIHWDIYTIAVQHEYLFSGQPFHDLKELSALNQLLSFSPGVREAFEGKHRSGTPRTGRSKADFEAGLVHNFLHPRYLKVNPANEVRIAATSFIRFDGINRDAYGSCLEDLARLAEVHHAFVNKLDFTDKGLVVLVLFGVPQSEGHTLFRICDFSLALLRMYPSLAQGIGWGNVFAGYVGNSEVQEYSVLGDAPNRSARLLDLAESGDILAGNMLRDDAHNHYIFRPVAATHFKGISESLPYYSLMGKQTRLHGQYKFVGRKKEAGYILNSLQQADAKTGKPAVYICGDPGIGKSRLLHEVLSHPELQNHSVFGHSCDAGFEPSLNMIKSVFCQLMQLERMELRLHRMRHFEQQWTLLETRYPHLCELKSVIGSLFDLSWQKSVWELTAPRERTELLEQSLIKCFKTIANDQVLLFSIDDGQWIDEDSLHMIRLLSAEPDLKLALVSACRYLPGAQKVDFRLPGHKNLYLDLPNLSTKESIQLVDEIMGSRLKSAKIRQLAERTMGNPLYIENLSSYVKEAESLEEGLSKVLDGNGFKSFGLSDVIYYRLDLMDDSLRECVLAASVLGLEFDTDILTQMLQRDISLELEHCSRHHIWYPTTDSHYAFSHVLIKDKAYSMMMLQKLNQHHKRAAGAMEVIYSDKLMAKAELIAYHYEQAGMIPQAAKYYDIAADYMWDKVQFGNSERLFIKACELMKDYPEADPLEYAEYVFHHGLLLHYLNDYPAAERLYLQNMEIQEKHRPKNCIEMSPYINNLGRLYKDMEQFSKAEPLLQKSLDLEIKAKHDFGTIADRQNNLAHLYSKQGKHKKALPLYISACERMKKEIGPESFHTGFMLNNIGMTYLALGKLDLAADHLRSSIRIKTKHYGADHPETAYVYFNLGRYHALTGEPEKALELFNKTLKIVCAAFGSDHPRNIQTLFELYKIAMNKGDLPTAARYTDQLKSIAARHFQLSTPDRKILTDLGINPEV
ncbi:MAG TPA: tetratricopeptide repeat protein [Candidatus Cloacimonadota bacterium]|nr:tetratricopeptide repeat protein [Candidatus Cloacimonadota bacterium]